MSDSLYAPRRLRAVLWLALLSPASCFALVCSVQGSGAPVLRGDLGSTVAIPESLPQGEVVWRSERQSVLVECAREDQQAVAQEVFVHLNPDNLNVGQGIRVGLSLGGADHFSGRIATGQVLPVCHEGDSNIGACPKVRFNLAFSVFVQKFGATPVSGVPADIPDYRVFQLGAQNGAQGRSGDSLSYVLNNLTGLRFIACDAQLQVYPSSLEFGELPIKQVVVGRVFDQRPFSLSTSRACDSPFSLDARFRPVTGSLERTLLIPANNRSLGIRIVRAADDQPLAYNESFHLTDLTQGTPVSQIDFAAQLIWHAPQPVPGPFSAEVMIDLYYK